MIPLVATLKEMANQAAIVNRVAEEVFKEKGTRVEYLVGHDDRAAAGGAGGGRDRQRSAILLLRHQRSDPDHVRLLA